MKLPLCHSLVRFDYISTFPTHDISPISVAAYYRILQAAKKKYYHYFILEKGMLPIG